MIIIIIIYIFYLHFILLSWFFHLFLQINEMELQKGLDAFGITVFIIIMFRYYIEW